MVSKLNSIIRKKFKYFLLTIFSIGLFIGFWLGFFVFAKVHIKVVCRPSGKVLIDITHGLQKEFVLSSSVVGCDSIELVISKPSLRESIFGSSKEKVGIKTTTTQKVVSSVPFIGGLSENQESSRKLAPPSEIGEPTNALKVYNLNVFGIC